MKNKYEISKEDAAKIREYRKLVKDKYTDRRLRAVQLRGEGLKNKEICEKLDCDKRQLSRWVSQYVHGGIAALNPKRGGRRRENMSIEEEKLFLEQFEDEAEKGRVIEVSEIKKAYEEKVGHKIGSGQIYVLLHRHGWRKIKPRSKHPKKASQEAIEASKKLKQKSMNQKIM